MALYLPDTDTVNYLLRRRSPAKERYLTAVLEGGRFVLSAVVHYEVTRYLRLRGSTRLLRAYHGIVPRWTRAGTITADWETAVDLWVQRHRAGRPIQDSDLLIAVTALRAGAVLVTNNVRDFDDLGLVVESWMLPAAP